jgi:hypothetical protein
MNLWWWCLLITIIFPRLSKIHSSSCTVVDSEVGCVYFLIVVVCLFEHQTMTVWLEKSVFLSSLSGHFWCYFPVSHCRRIERERIWIWVELQQKKTQLKHKLPFDHRRLFVSLLLSFGEKTIFFCQCFCCCLIDKPFSKHPCDLRSILWFNLCFICPERDKRLRRLCSSFIRISETRKGGQTSREFMSNQWTKSFTHRIFNTLLWWVIYR